MIESDEDSKRAFEGLGKRDGQFSSSEETSSTSSLLGGKKRGKKGKKNTMKLGKKPKGHKTICKCPVCKNIRNKKHRQTKRK